MVLTSTITRGVMTALSWLVSPPYPLRSFAAEPEARQWLKSQLAT